MKALAAAAILTLLPQVQTALPSDLSDLEHASGWVSMSDEASRAAWVKPAEGWSFDRQVLHRFERYNGTVLDPAGRI